MRGVVIQTAGAKALQVTVWGDDSAAAETDPSERVRSESARPARAKNTSGASNSSAHAVALKMAL